MEGGAVGLTQEHIDSARAAGACREALKMLKVGRRVELLPQVFLIWADANLSRLHSGDLWMLANAGYGYGPGYGNGDGAGYGDGYGTCYGYGTGYGNGAGAGEIPF